jgi:hypothetical protein
MVSRTKMKMKKGTELEEDVWSPSFPVITMNPEHLPVPGVP